MVASVPELTRRTFSIDGTASTTMLGQVDLASVGAPNDVPSAAAAWTALTHRGCGVAEDQRSPRADVVDVGVAVDVVEQRALAAAR